LVSLSKGLRFQEEAQKMKRRYKVINKSNPRSIY